MNRLYDGLSMRGWSRAAVAAALAGSLVGCATIFGHQYEYEEQWTLATDGSASVEIDASIPALVALRGLSFGTGVKPVEPADVRRVFEAEHCVVQHVSQPWIRHGRRFVQAVLTVADVRHAGDCGVLNWSTYAFDQQADGIHYHAVVGAPVPGGSADPQWTGGELVAFKLHLPSKITFHNVRDLETGLVGAVERGNILTWEERLSDRLAGKPIDISVVMDARSILNRTLWLFAGAFAAAIASLALVVALVVRKGRRDAR
jgi:hypothetical protein